MGLIYEAVCQWAVEDPNKLAIIEVGGESLTYQELSVRTTLIASNLQRMVQGIRGYETSRADYDNPPPIMMLSRDSVDTIATILASNSLNLTIAPMNPNIGEAALAKARDAIGADIILHDCHHIDSSCTLSGEACSAISIESLLADNGHVLQTVRLQGDYPFLLTLSSGSTGDPKPVIYSDAGKLQRARHTATEFGFESDDTILCASPFFHSLGQRLTFMPLLLGSTMVLLPRFSAQYWLDAVAKHEVTGTICVSSHLFALKDQLVECDPRARTIRVLVSSSASIDLATKSALFDSHKFDFYEMYGASEVATASCLGHTDAIEKRSSVGRACQGVKIQILDSNDEIVAAETTGEISIHSPLCTPGYYRRQDLNDNAFSNGWFRTGDLGYLDADGYLYFVDRTSDVIVSGGSNIYPSDIEACLRDHPSIKDCLVFGVPDSYLGEAVVAVVVTIDQTQNRLELSIRRHARRTLASTQQPMLYFIVDELPLNGAGKIDRKAVRKYYGDMNLDPSSRFTQALMAKADSS